MNNFEHAVEATETAINSSGSAAEENSRYMESLAAKVQLLRSSFQELSSSIVDSNLVKTILDVGNVLLYLGKTPIGNIVVQAGLISGVLWGGTGLISAMKIIPNLLGKVSKKVSGINALLTLAPSKLFAIGTAISAVLFIIQQVRDYIEKHDLNYLQEQIESNNQELESTKQRKGRENRNISNTSETRARKNEIKKVKTNKRELDFSFKKSRLKIAPLGGLGEIGKNITIFEYEDEIVVVDCGLEFPEDDMLGVDLVIPDVTYLIKNKDRVKGIVITHGHEDHKILRHKKTE